MDPTKNRNGTPDQERAESKILKTGKAYQSRESWANGNPGPFHDPHIAAYLARHARELSGDPIELRNFFLASYAYGKFQRLGTPECRRYAWHLIQLACRLSAKSRQGDIAVTQENRVLGHREKPDSAEGSK